MTLKLRNWRAAVIQPGLMTLAVCIPLKPDIFGGSMGLSVLRVLSDEEWREILEMS